MEVPSAVKMDFQSLSFDGRFRPMFTRYSAREENFAARRRGVASNGPKHGQLLLPAGERAAAACIGAHGGEAGGERGGVVGRGRGREPAGRGRARDRRGVLGNGGPVARLGTVVEGRVQTRSRSR